MDIERRFLAQGTVTVEKRADGKPVITGYAAVFYDPKDEGSEYQLYDDVYERVMPRCFDAALAEQQDVRALINHNPDRLLGRTSAGTCRLSVDKKGLRYEIDPPDTQDARDLMASIQRGDMSGSSFSFKQRDQSFRDIKDDVRGRYTVRELNSVEMFDVGPVAFPAYKSTTAGMRCAASDREQLERELAVWRQSHTLTPKALLRARQLLAERGL